MTFGMRGFLEPRSRTPSIADISRQTRLSRTGAEKTAQRNRTIERELEDIRVSYRESRRYVKCFCGESVRKSIVRHMKTKHQQVWKRWIDEFVRLRNLGYSYRRIMNMFRNKGEAFLFSWTVIEREILKAAEAGTVELKVWEKKNIRAWEPSEFQLEKTTVWDFRRRGDWAVHRSDYRGNWAPQIPRNLILRFTKKGDLVLDPFVGGGTTMIETWLTDRRGVGVDISTHALRTATARIKELKEKDSALLAPKLKAEYEPLIIGGDARNLCELVTAYGFEEGSFDLICAHPPYLNSLRYTEAIDGDLSHVSDLNLFLKEVATIVAQMHKLLRNGGICAVLVGDVRKDGAVVPLGIKLAEQFIDSGFKFKDIVVKLQHHDMSTEFWYNASSLDFMIAHEYLFIFRK